MNRYFQLLTIILIPLFFIYCSTAYAEEKITPYTPEEVGTAPVEIVKPEKKGGVSWFWLIIGIAAIGGGVAAAAGGGKKDTSSSTSGTSSSGSGTYTVTW